MNLVRLKCILVFMLFPLTAVATRQRPDMLEYEGKMYEFCFSDNPRILDDYFKQQGIPKPKILEHKGSSLWRGYIGLWRVADDRLYLTALFPEIYIEEAIPLGTIFKTEGPVVLAEWFTGEIDFRRTETRREKKLVAGSKDHYFEVVYVTVESLIIEKGRILRIGTSEESTEDHESLLNGTEATRECDPGK